jgi:hypothetical protein
MPLNNDFKIKNNLNTIGKILSGGVDIATIFSPSNTSWTLSAVNGTFGVAGGDTLSIQGGNGVDVRVATGTDTVRISGIDATASVKGVASFHADNFLVTNGVVTVKDGGIANAELAVISSAGKVSNSATTATKNNVANFIVARGASGEFSAGNISSSDTVQAVTVNATTGFRLDNTATSGNFLRGNGAHFVSSAIQAADVPTLNQSTSGSAATLTTTRTLWGQNFNGNQNITGSLTGVGNITGSGAITIQPFATNQDISLTTSGTGEVNIAKVDIDSGTIDGVSIGTASPATQLIVDEIEINSNIVDLKPGSSATSLQINTNSSTVPIIFNGNNAGANAIISSGIGGDLILGTNLNNAANARLTLDDATNGNITFGLNGTGSVVIPRADINGGTIDNTSIGASTASTGRFTQVVVDNITIDGNTISSTNANGNIDLTPNGSGEVNITKVDIDSGTIDGVSIGSSSVATYLKVDNVAIDNNNISFGSGAGQLTFLGSGNLSHGTSPGYNFISIGSAGIQGNLTGPAGADLVIGTNYNDSSRSRITLDEATNGNITFATNGTGSVVIPKADINAGNIDGTAIGASSASTGKFTQVDVDNITINGNTISSTNANGNIDLTPNGSGEVNITKVDIDGGTINGTSIGLSVPASGVFTGISVAGNVNISGSLFVAGSSTTINTRDLVISDPIIYLAEGNEGDTVDMGFVVAYDYDQEPHRHAGLIRDNTSKKWTLFSNLSTEVLSATQIPFNDPSLVISTLRANIEGTLTGNVSGVASQAVQLVTGWAISTTGDVTYTSGSFNGTANVTGTATIANNAVTTAKILDDNVTYAKIQNVTASDRILGRSTAGAGIIEEITCTAAGRALLDDSTASVQRVTLGLGPTDSVTFSEVIVNNGTRSVLNDVYNTTVTSTNVATLATFATASYNSTKYTVQIKQGTTRRAALEIIATKDNGTWEGTVYGIIDQGNIFSNVEISVTGSTVDLVFTFNGNANYTVTAYAQAISD